MSGGQQRTAPTVKDAFTPYHLLPACCENHFGEYDSAVNEVIGCHTGLPAGVRRKSRQHKQCG
jgi:hypothetical protein